MTTHRQKNQQKKRSIAIEYRKAAKDEKKKINKREKKRIYQMYTERHWNPFLQYLKL